MIVIDNKLGYRIIDLAEKNHKTFIDQLDLMTKTFETMNIQRISFFPSQPGCHPVPLIEIYGDVIQRRVSG